MRYTKTLPVAVLALLATAACDTSELVAPEDAGARRPAPVAPQAALWTSDAEFARAARAEAPGFAGYYLESDGTPVLRVVNPGDNGAAAERYVAPQVEKVLRGARFSASPARRPIIRAAAYDFAQLADWSEQLHSLLAREGVFLIDVDEKENRVLVGVGDVASQAMVRAEAVKLGIPASALHVQTQARPQNRALVRDRLASTAGGIQISFSQYLCTLGFNARRVSTGANIYVTNAHCTGTQYANDGIAIYQANVVAGSQIGNEVADRGMYACAGAGTSCRRADAAYISNNGTRAISQGGIARTAWATGAAGGLTITGEYDIVGRYTGSLPVGTILDKTGRTSGSTYGQVTNSCVTIGVLRCQDISKVWSQGGDSGSPVFIWLGGSGTAENDVQLVGVMWGGPGSDFTTTYSSRLSGIEQDLGALSNLCRPGYGC